MAHPLESVINEKLQIHVEVPSSNNDLMSPTESAGTAQQNWKSKEESVVNKRRLWLYGKFSDMFENEEMSDLTLAVKEDINATPTQFSAHKLILAMHSPVFKEMVMVSSKLDKVQITNTRPSAVKALLRYLYTGTAGLCIKLALPLAHLATNLQITWISDLCLDYVKQRLSKKNIWRIMDDAVYHGISNISKICENYIVENSPGVFSLLGFKENLRPQTLLYMLDSKMKLNSPFAIKDMIPHVEKWLQANCYIHQKKKLDHVMFLKPMKRQLFGLRDLLQERIRFRGCPGVMAKTNIILEAYGAAKRPVTGDLESYALRSPYTNNQTPRTVRSNRRSTCTSSQVTAPIVRYSKELRDQHENGTESNELRYSIIRGTVSTKSDWYFEGQKDCIQFSVDTVIELLGIGVFPPRETSAFMTLTIVSPAGRIVAAYEEKLPSSTKRSQVYSLENDILPVMFKKSVIVSAKMFYSIELRQLGGRSKRILDGQPSVVSGGVIFKFKNKHADDELESNGTSIKTGQIPSLYFRKIDPVSRNTTVNGNQLISPIRKMNSSYRSLSSKSSPIDGSKFFDLRKRSKNPERRTNRDVTPRQIHGRVLKGETVTDNYSRNIPSKKIEQE